MRDTKGGFGGEEENCLNVREKDTFAKINFPDCREEADIDKQRKGCGLLVRL